MNETSFQLPAAAQGEWTVAPRPPEVWVACRRAALTGWDCGGPERLTAVSVLSHLPLRGMGPAMCPSGPIGK